MYLTYMTLMLAFTAQAAQGRAEILIEAEGYAHKISEFMDFASLTREYAASRRRVLFRYFKKGYVVYRFRVPVDKTYTGWLRYGAKHEQPIGVCMNPTGEPRFTKVLLPATGGYVGPGVWGWALIFEAELAAGEHTLALSNAAIRPDCIFVSAGKHRPVDEKVLRQRRRPSDPRTSALLKRQLVQVRPSWLNGASDYRLPEWYGQYRVHAHTRLSPAWIERDIFFKAAQALREMGVHTFVRHIKTGAEGAWWQSKVGAVLSAARDRNIARELIDNAHKAGCRIIVYHRHMEDDWAVAEHPDWAARDCRGQIYRARGNKACFNSPYADFVLTRLLELVDMGADGFCFDEVHMPKAGCWCPFCKRKFKVTTGLDHPKEPDPDDPVWHRLIDFNNLTIERTFLAWRQAIHQRNPSVVMLIGSNTWPTMGERHMTHRLFRIADSMKTEFSLPARKAGSWIFGFDKTIKPTEKDARIALGYTLARDSCDGRPAHIWTHGLLNETATLYASAGMMTHGCIANLDIPEPTIPNMMFRKAFELGDRVSPYFARRMPMRWAAVHYSEYARDKYILDESEKWKKVLYPVYGPYCALLRAHLPVGIVTDSQLEEGLLEGCRLLFVSAPTHLTRRMREVITEFKAKGGMVVEQRASWQWHDPNGGQEGAIAGFMRAIDAEAQRAPVQAWGGPEKMHVVPFATADHKGLTISFANDFSWVYTGRKRTRDGKKIDLSPYLTPPAACKGVKVVIRSQRPPKRAFEAVSGKALELRACKGGVEVTVPDFEYMAVVVAEYE